MHSACSVITLPSAHCAPWITIHSYRNKTNLNSFQDNANKYQPWFVCFPPSNISVFVPLSAHRAFLSFSGVAWKVSLFSRIKAEEKPGLGQIHVAHTGWMLCMDNWLSKQHGHRWILMVLLKCHLTDVTAAPILKRLVSKTSIRAHSSPTVSARDSAVCQASISERHISHSQPYLHRTVHPLPEVHWTFPIIGLYRSPFKVEIKHVGIVSGGHIIESSWDLFIGGLSTPKKAQKNTPLAAKYPVRQQWRIHHFYRKVFTPIPGNLNAKLFGNISNIKSDNAAGIYIKVED